MIVVLVGEMEEGRGEGGGGARRITDTAIDWYYLLHEGYTLDNKYSR